MISIIGSGIVGKSVGLGLEGLGEKVIFYDINPSQLRNLKNTTTSLKEAINQTDISFICVPTPYPNQLEILLEVFEKILEYIKEKEDYHLIVIKSTILPGTIKTILVPLIKSYFRGLNKVGICMNPEFLTEINSSWSEDEEFNIGFLNEPHIIIGGVNKKSCKKLGRLYKKHPAYPPIYLDVTSAEMIKYASNLMLATKISYWNTISEICKKQNINSGILAEILGKDNRIGVYGTVHGKAFGGKCLPKDLKTFIEWAGNPCLLKCVDEVNENMKNKYGVRE